MNINQINNQQAFSAKGDFVSHVNPKRLAKVSSKDERIVQFPIGDKKDCIEVMYEITSDAEKKAWNFNFGTPEDKKAAIADAEKKLNLLA